MPDKGLRPTKKQRELLEFIANFIHINGYSPTYREIMTGCNYNSPATVSKHVQNLIARGHLAKRDKSARSLELVKTEIKAPVNLVDTESHKDWLCSQIDQHLANKGSKDDLYVLVGALKVLGFDKEMRKYAKKLS